MKALALLLLLFSGSAYTCTCSYPPFEEQFAKATYVFAGRVLSVESGGPNRLIAQFKVLKAYKGIKANEIEIRTEEGPGTCGYPFELQAEYLIYATGKEQPEVSLCSRSKILRQAKEDLDLLDKRLQTQQEVMTNSETDESRDKKRILKKDVPKTLTVSAATIVGITRTPDGYVALIRAAGKVYSLKVGDPLHDGSVLAITDHAVTFRQLKGYSSVLVKKEFRAKMPEDQPAETNQD